MAEEEEKKTKEGEETPNNETPEKSRDDGTKEDLPIFTGREIDKMNVPKLKDTALQYQGKIVGVHGMDKAQLILSLKQINNIPTEKSLKTTNVDRKGIKDRIRSLRKERDAAIDEKDRVKLKRIRKRAKALRRTLVRTA